MILRSSIRAIAVCTLTMAAALAPCTFVAAQESIDVTLHLQLGRALAFSGDTIKAKAAYQDFFTLWKDADADTPILRQAKAGYAKLQ